MKFFKKSQEKELPYLENDLTKDIDTFNGILEKEIRKIEDKEVTLGENNTTTVNDLIINSLVYEVAKTKVYPIMDISDYNSYVDLGEADKTFSKTRVSNIEDYILLLLRNLQSNAKSLKINIDLYHNAYTTAYFDYVDTKRLSLHRAKSKGISYRYSYFGQFYNTKSLYKVGGIKKGIDLNTEFNRLDKIFSREGIEAFNRSIFTILTNITNDIKQLSIKDQNAYTHDENSRKFIEIFTESNLLALAYSSMEYLEQVNKDYILRSGVANAKNTLSVLDCLGNRYLPLYTNKRSVEAGGEISEITTSVIVTTLDTLLTRFKGDINNAKDSLGYSDSHFGNFIKAYDDDHLYKEYIILTDEQFQDFYTYMELSEKFYKDLLDSDRKVKGALSDLDATVDSEARREFEDILLKAMQLGVTDLTFKPMDERGIVVSRMPTGIRVTNERTYPIELLEKMVRYTRNLCKVESGSLLEPVDGECELNLKDMKKGIDYFANLRFSFPQGIRVNRTYIRLNGVRTSEDGDISKKKTLTDLGYKPKTIETIKNALNNNSNGFVFVTGPTGSGKSSCQYAIIEEFIPQRPEVHLLTAEDPIERKLNFTNVEQNKIGKNISFETMLKSFLRQDPDWIMFGETRDLGVLRIGMQAAKSGHLTLTTLHTNSSKASLDRLSELLSDGNVSAYESSRRSVLADTRLIISVKLVPKLCPHCKTKDTRDNVVQRVIKKGYTSSIAEQLVEANGDFYQRNNKGCSKCDLGYIGKQVIVDLMDLSTEETYNQILNNDYSSIVSQFEDGMTFVNEGIFDIDTLSKIASK